MLPKTLACSSLLLFVIGCGSKSVSPLDVESFHHYCAKNDVESVKMLIANNPRIIDEPDTPASLRAPLHIAAEAGSEDVVKILIDHGARLDARRATCGSLPLHVACKNGHTRIVGMLFTKETAEAQDNLGRTPLHVAAGSGRDEVVNSLLRAGCRVDIATSGTPLHMAAENGHASSSLLLLAKGANPNAKRRPGETPLYLASIQGHAEVIAVLAKHGAEPDAFSAAGLGDVEFLRKVMKSDPSVITTKDPMTGMTLLHVAAMAGQEKVAAYLIENKADINAVTRGNFPLHLAAQKGHPGMIRLLIKSGTNANARRGREETPLHVAVEEDRLEAVRTLLDLGADINAVTTSKETPLHYSITYPCRGQIVELLMERGADPWAADHHGNTPLNLVVYSAQKSVKLPFLHKPLK